jgi:uncharacterized protein (DUF488 family)
MASATELFTIGFQDRDLEEVLATLWHHRVTRVIDVRDLPQSSHRGFSKNPLGGALRSSGIDYLHMREVGNPFRHLAVSCSTVLKHYSDHLGRRLEILDHAAQAVRGERAALLCFERDSSRCHRSVLAARLAGWLGVTAVNL